MAHFAKIDSNKKVIEVIVIKNTELLDENQNENESRGIEFCRNLFGGDWVQTSYNKNFRKNFANVGYTYDEQRDAFIPPKPFNSWILNEETCCWQAPVEFPNDGNKYQWNENNQQWESIDV